MSKAQFCTYRSRYYPDKTKRLTKSYHLEWFVHHTDYIGLFSELAIQITTWSQKSSCKWRWIIFLEIFNSWSHKIDECSYCHTKFFIQLTVLFHSLLHFHRVLLQYPETVKQFFITTGHVSRTFLSPGPSSRRPNWTGSRDESYYLPDEVVVGQIFASSEWAVSSSLAPVIRLCLVTAGLVLRPLAMFGTLWESYLPKWKKPQ
jgi:hypothetical protein